MVTFVAPKRTTIRARSGLYRDGRLKAIRLIVWHTGETGEGSTPAEGMGRWFQDSRAGGSAHKGVDTDSICHYVDDNDTAYGAQGANADGLHLEVSGRAAQTTTQWKDDASLRTLENGAIAAAEWAVKYKIPLRWLTTSQIRDGVTKGFTTHNFCRLVFGGSHTDPGLNFPAAYVMSRVQFHVTRLTGVKPPAPQPPKAPVIAVDGSMGKATILRWQQVMGTKADGVISESGSMLTEAVQRFLISKGMRDYDGKALVPDGKGIYSNSARTTPKTRTHYALQRYLGTTRDGIFSHPTSNGVSALQKRLNAAASGSKKF